MMFGCRLLLITSPINTTPRMITAAMTGRYCPIAAKTVGWLNFGAIVGEGVGFEVVVGLDVNIEVGVGVRVGAGEAVGV